MFQSQIENLKNCFWALCSQPKKRFFVVNTVFLFCFLDRKILSNFKIPNKVCKKVKKRLWASCSQQKNLPFYFVTEKIEICYPRTCPFFKFRRRKGREYEKWKKDNCMENNAKIDCEHNAQNPIFEWFFLWLRICYPRTCPFFKFRRRKGRECEKWKKDKYVDNILAVFGHEKRPFWDC